MIDINKQKTGLSLLLQLNPYQTKKLGKVFWDIWSVWITRQGITPTVTLVRILWFVQWFVCGTVGGTLVLVKY